MLQFAYELMLLSYTNSQYNICRINICISSEIQVSYGGNYEEYGLLGQTTSGYTQEDNILP